MAFFTEMFGKPKCHSVRSWTAVAATFISKMIFFFLVYSQVSVALSSGSIRVAMLEENGERVLMEGKLTHKINTESSLWSLEPGKCVLVSVVTVCRALRCVSNLL